MAKLSFQMNRLIDFWIHRIHPRLASLITSIGVVGLLICLVVLLGVSWLSQEVWEKEAFSFDKTLLLWLHQWSNPALDWLMLNITRLGNPATVSGIVAGSFIWLGWKRRFAELRMFAIACVGAVILNQGMKLFFAKSRPELWTRLISEKSFSFPSGHALGSLVLYGFLAFILATAFPKGSRLVYAIAIVLIAAIGLSRLYLGVHWPTDVLAGYGVGFLWLMTCITMLKLQTQVKTTNLFDT